MNKGKGRPHPKVSDIYFSRRERYLMFNFQVPLRLERALRSYYAPLNQKLYKLVGYNFNWAEKPLPR